MSAEVARPLRLPARCEDETSTYVVRARPQRSFHTVLDAHQLFDPARRYLSKVDTRIQRDARGAAVGYALSLEQDLLGGALRERLECSLNGGLRARRFARTLLDAEGVPCREESADFERGPLRLPPDTYPETFLPFLIRTQALERGRRSVHAWIADRMVAKVYFELTRHGTFDLPIGRMDVHEVVMYPDLNDWVKLGRVLTELARPLLPKYRMWYEAAPPQRLARFEGPYGPPGAPELVLELLA